MAVSVAPRSRPCFLIIPFRIIKTIKTMNLYAKKHSRAVLCFVKSKFLHELEPKALIMRVSILALLLSVSGLLIARDGKGQDLDKIIVSVQFRNVTLKNALHRIEKLTNLPFAYKTS